MRRSSKPATTPTPSASSAASSARADLALGTARPVLSLTTDFGLHQPFVGLMKGVILNRCPDARVIDLTHHVAPFAVAEGGFWLEHCFRYLPAGTIHVAVVDPGVGSSRSILAIEWEGHAFLAPDNGLLGHIAGKEGARVCRVADEVLLRHGLPQVSTTFHGRDLFAPLAADLAAGRLRLADLGPVVVDARPSPVPPALQVGHRWRGEVLLVDTFGNCFSNLYLSSNNISRIREVRFGTQLLPLVRTYSERPVGTGIALVNAFGVLEAACVEGRADQRLGLHAGSPVEVVLDSLSSSRPGGARKS